VLYIKIADAGEDIHTARFRIATNLDQSMAKQFWVEPTVPGLKVTSLQPILPFAMEGFLRIDNPSKGGEVGLVVSLYSREIFRRDNLARLVLPDLGRNGLTKGIACPDSFHRPGDLVQLTLKGSGFSPEDAGALKARVQGFDMGPASFSYVSPTEIRFTFSIPPAAPEGYYGVAVMGANGQVLKRAKDAFMIIPPLWLSSVQVSPAPTPGRKSTLRIIGRDLTPEFAKNLQVTTDEPGIRISGLVLTDASTLAAEIALSTAVAPGDYWLHLEAEGKPVKPQSGSFIKVKAIQ